MRSERRLGLLVLAVLGGCSCAGVADEDGGTDAPLDVPGDTPDVPPDEDAPIDAGPWQPAFAPRIIYRNPDVTCAPAELTYSPPARTPAPPGTVRWVYRPLADAAAVTALESAGADPFQFAPWSIFGTTDGGLAVGIDLDRGTLLLVRPDGTLRTALQGYYSPVRMTVGPEDGVLRAEGRMSILRWGASAVSAFAPELPLLGTLPGRIRTELVDPFSGLTRQPDPVLLPDGTLVWSPTTSTLFGTCVRGGQTRWILEYDLSGAPLGVPFGFFGDARGGLLLFAHDVYHLSADADVLSSRTQPTAGYWTPTSYSERCGVSGPAYDVAIVDGRREAINQRVFYLSGPGLEVEHVVPFPGTATAECGVLSPWTREDGYQLRRYAPTGERVWSYPTGAAAIEFSLLELADGSVLIIWEDGARAPALTLIDASGVAQEFPLDPAEVGPQLTHNAHYVTPDGVLYLASQGDFSANPRIIAIELGVGPAMPYPDGDGLDWARTNAAWLSAR